MSDFTVTRATSLAEALAAFGKSSEARYLAGGQTLIPVLKQRLATPSDLIDLSRVPDLGGIRVDSGVVAIGALATHAQVAASNDVKRSIPSLAQLAQGIGDPQVRNRGTLGGSLANNDPAADYPAAVLGLGATIVTDRRRIASDDFFQGLFTTALEGGEIITAVEFPVPQRAAFVKLPHPASRYCLVAAFVSDGPSGVRVAVTGAGSDGVFRATALEAALAKSFAPEALDGVTIAESGMLADMHAGADYRAHLVPVLARRAVSKAMA